MKNETDQHTRRLSDQLKLNIKYSAVIKFIHVAINLYLVHLSIELAGDAPYGNWLTLLSIFTWFSAISVGLNNSFRKQLTKQFEENNLEQFMKTTNEMFWQSALHYANIFLVCAIALYWLPVHLFFEESGMDDGSLKILFISCLFMYFTHFVFSAIDTILLAIHKARQSYTLLFLQSAVSLVIFLAMKYTQTSVGIVEVCLAYSLGPLLTSVFGWIYYTRKLPISYSLRGSGNGPTFRSRMLKSSTTLKFFVIQLATLTLFTTDNLAIMNLVSPGEVAAYQIAYKYFNIIVILFNIILVPFWAAFSSASDQKSQDWLRKKLGQLSLVWLGFVACALVMLAVSAPVFALWIGDGFQVDFWVSISAMAFILQLIWNTIPVTSTPWKKLILKYGFWFLPA